MYSSNTSVLREYVITLKKTLSHRIEGCSEKCGSNRTKNYNSLFRLVTGHRSDVVSWNVSLFTVGDGPRLPPVTL